MKIELRPTTCSNQPKKLNYYLYNQLQKPICSKSDL